MRFGKKGKLSPRSIGLFEILDRVGTVTYRLALPPQLSLIQYVFHVLMLRKYKPDPSHILAYEALELREDMSYMEQPIQILDPKEQVLRKKTIPIVKILWNHHSLENSSEIKIRPLI